MIRKLPNKKPELKIMRQFCSESLILNITKLKMYQKV